MRRRLGGVPPIVTVLVVIASTVAASMVAWFLWASTRAATQQPVLEVTSAYVTCTGSTTGSTCAVSFTVRNVGTQQITSITLVEISCETTSGPRALTPNAGCLLAYQTASCRATFNATISDGASCTASLSVGSSAGSSRVALGFKVIRP